MPFAGTSRGTRQHQNSTCNTINDLGPTGSWFAFTCAVISAACLIFSAGAQNVAHGYSLGLASSEFRALVLALASAGASILGPFAWVAVFRGRGLGPRAVALLLALGCLAYAGVCSLGFVAGSRDLAITERSITADAYADSRAVAEAARHELATLKGQTKAVMERRRELAKILASTSTGKSTAAPVQIDAQAASLAFYIRASGYAVTDQAMGVWLNLGMTLFLEMAAALSLTVAAALRPMPRQWRLAASPAPAFPAEAPVLAKVETALQRPGKGDDDDPPAPPPRGKGRPGRPRDVLPEAAIEKIRAAGGKANGSLAGIGKLIGSKSKTSAGRLLHELAGMGLVRLTTGPRGCSVMLIAARGSALAMSSQPAPAGAMLA